MKEICNMFSAPPAPINRETAIQVLNNYTWQRETTNPSQPFKITAVMNHAQELNDGEADLMDKSLKALGLRKESPYSNNLAENRYIMAQHSETDGIPTGKPAMCHIIGQGNLQTLANAGIEFPGHDQFHQAARAL